MPSLWKDARSDDNRCECKKIRGCITASKHYLPTLYTMSYSINTTVLGKWAREKISIGLISKYRVFRVQLTPPIATFIGVRILPLWVIDCALLAILYQDCRYEVCTTPIKEVYIRLVAAHPESSAQTVLVGYDRGLANHTQTRF